MTSAAARELQDLARVEIMDLASRYAVSVDNRDWPTFLSCFAPDAILHMGIPQVDLNGRAAMQAHLERLLANFDGTQHLTSNHSYVVDGDHATGGTSFVAYHWTGEGANREVFAVGGRYQDALARSDSDGWQFTDRRIAILWTTGTHHLD
jgi:ketosteroid isomerase-like protein